MGGEAVEKDLPSIYHQVYNIRYNLSSISFPARRPFRMTGRQDRKRGGRLLFGGWLADLIPGNHILKRVTEKAWARRRTCRGFGGRCGVGVMPARVG